MWAKQNLELESRLQRQREEAHIRISEDEPGSVFGSELQLVLRMPSRALLWIQRVHDDASARKEREKETTTGPEKPWQRHC